MARFVFLVIAHALWIADSASFQIRHAPVLRTNSFLVNKCGTPGRPPIKPTLALNSKSLSASEQAELAEMQGFVFSEHE